MTEHLTHIAVILSTGALLYALFAAFPVKP
jgi:hypothetical protein